MTFIRRVVAITILVGLYASLALQAFAEGEQSAEQKNVESSIQVLMRHEGEPTTASLLERMKHYRVPGVSVTVLSQGKIAWSQSYGYADADQKTPATVDSLFQAASISKPVSMAGALRLVEQGKLSLTEDINNKLKRWKIPENSFSTNYPVTLRLLMSHRAGTNVHGFMGYDSSGPIPTLVQVLKGEKPANSEAIKVARQPGRAFSYSGGGTSIVQLAMEDVTNLPFDQLMEREVLHPSGMNSSTYSQPLPASKVSLAASGHDSKGKPIPGRFKVHPEQAAAGLWTTSADLARFVIAIQDSYAGKSNSLLTKETATKMLTPVEKGEVGLGPFLHLDHGKVIRFGHGGSNVGFRCQLEATTESGNGAIVMTNSDEGGPLVDEILWTIARTYRWPGSIPNPRTVVKLSDADVKNIVGDYSAGLVKIGSILLEGEHIILRAPQGSTELFFESPTKFFNSAVGLEGSIVPGENPLTLQIKFQSTNIKVKKIVPKKPNAPAKTS